MCKRERERECVCVCLCVRVRCLKHRCRHCFFLCAICCRASRHNGTRVQKRTPTSSSHTPTSRTRSARARAHVCMCVCVRVCVCLCFSLTHIVNLAVQHALFVSFLLSSRAQALPVIGRCIAGMVEAINMVDADADTELVVSNYRTGNAVPTDVAEHDPVRARACVYVCMCACVCPSPVPLPSPRLCTWPHPLPLGLG